MTQADPSTPTRPAQAVGSPWPKAWVWAALAMATGCAAPPPGGCGARMVPLRNASALAVEQVFGGDGSAGGWGSELLGSTNLAPGQSRTLRLPAGARAMRLVWVNGRDAEMQGVDLCRVAGLTLTDQGLRPE